MNRNFRILILVEPVEEGQLKPYSAVYEFDALDMALNKAGVTFTLQKISALAREVTRQYIVNNGYQVHTDPIERLVTERDAQLLREYRSLQGDTDGTYT